jgi:hypothetical protein
MNITLNLKSKPGIAVIVRDPVTRRKLHHQLYTNSQMKKARQVIDQYTRSGMDVVTRRIDVLMNF